MNVALVQASMLVGLAGCLIPVLIHLLHRQTPREIPIGTIRFLRVVMERQRYRRNIMRWLLMILRISAIAILVMIFCRPYRTFNAAGSELDNFVAVLIDASASMQVKVDGVRLVDTAVRQAREIVGANNPGTQCQLAFFDEQVHPVPVGDDDSYGERFAQLTAPQNLYAGTDYATALRWAQDVCVNTKARTSHIHLFTDLQQSGLQEFKSDAWPAGIEVEIHDLGRTVANNVAITAVTARPLVVRPGDPAKVQVVVWNGGQFTVEDVPIVCRLTNDNRSTHLSKSVRLPPGATETLEFELPGLAEGIWQGSVLVELSDDLAFDNQRFLAVLALPQRRVLLVDQSLGANSTPPASRNLQLALALTPTGAPYGNSPFATQISTNLSSLESVDSVVLCNLASIGELEAAKLKTFVDSGGGLVVFTGDRTTAAGYAALSLHGLAPGEIIAPREAYDLPWRVETWDSAHPVFAPFSDPQVGDLRRLSFRGRVEIARDSNARVLATTHDATPWVLEQPMSGSAGKVIWVTTACDNSWSPWTQSELYVPITHQILGYVTGMNHERAIRESLLMAESGTVPTSVPGVFPPPPAWEVVNVSPRESNLERCSPKEFASQLGIPLLEKVPERVSRTGMLESPLAVRRHEVWHALLFALMLVAAAEFFLSNRITA